MTAEDTEAMIGAAEETLLRAAINNADQGCFNACQLLFDHRAKEAAALEASRQRVERLRKVLRWAEHGTVLLIGHGQSNEEDLWDFVQQLQEKARAALEQDPPATAKAEGEQ